MTKVLTPLALDQLQKQFALALGVPGSSVTQKLDVHESVVVSLSVEQKNLKGNAVVHVQELAERLRFSVDIRPCEDRDQVRISLCGTVQICTYQEGPP